MLDPAAGFEHPEDILHAPAPARAADDPDRFPCGPDREGGQQDPPDRGFIIGRCDLPDMHTGDGHGVRDRPGIVSGGRQDNAPQIEHRGRIPQPAGRVLLAGRAFLPADFRRSVSPSTSMSIMPAGGPPDRTSNSVLRPALSPLPLSVPSGAGVRLCLARTGRRRRGRRRCRANIANMSASRSRAVITRVRPPASRRAALASRKPPIP